METEALRTALEKTGITQYEADAYIALIEYGTATVSEIAESSDVPQTRIYDIVENLAERGYVEIYRGDNITVQANDPNAVIDTLETQADTFLDAADELEQRWTKPDVQHSSLNIVSQPRTALEEAKTWIDEAEYSIEMILTLDQFESFREELAGAYDRGVVSKLMLVIDWDADDAEGRYDPESPPGTPIDRDDPALPDRFEGYATEVRSRDMPARFMLIADRKRACYTPEVALPAANRFGVIADDFSVARMLYWFFETCCWNIWDVVYSERDDQLPAVYSNIRECLHRIVPHLEADHRVVLSVTGQTIDTGESVEITGEVTDYEYTDDFEQSYPPLESFVRRATIWIESNGQTYSVGGWQAHLEDIEGFRYTVELIDTSAGE